MTTDRDDIASLLERVKAATGPDRGLDARIQHAMFPDQRVLLDGGKAFGPGEKRPPTYGTLRDVDLSDWDDVNADATDKDGMAGLFEAPTYTASIDSALALVERLLPGWTIASMSQGDNGLWTVELREGFLTSYGRVVIEPDHWRGTTLPLAILAALLAALLSTLTQDSPNVRP